MANYLRNGSRWIRARRHHRKQRRPDFGATAGSAATSEQLTRLNKKRAEATELVASATSAKQGGYLKRIAVRLFRKVLQLPTPHELRREDRRQQTDDWEKRARFRNWIDPGGYSPFLEPAVTLTGEIENHVLVR